MNVRDKYAKLTRLLIKKKLSITTMESCTGGLLASLITDTEGSSAIIKGAFVTYSNEAKILQGVPKDIIEKYSVYSKETAAAMASACRNAYCADIGIGVTGTMGNIDPMNTEASEPGQVYFAFNIKGRSLEYHIELTPKPSRLDYKMVVADNIYEKLIENL